MQRLLRSGRLEQDQHRYLEAGQSVPPDGLVLVPGSTWTALTTDLQDSKRVGVWMNVDEEPETIAAGLDRVPVLAIRFPAFNDGRGLSLAVLLRTRYRYLGELRAIGAVHEDLTHYLLRCGFDTILFPEGRNLATALRWSSAMIDYYQASVVEPLPAFRRVARGRR